MKSLTVLLYDRISQNCHLKKSKIVVEKIVLPRKVGLGENIKKKIYEPLQNFRQVEL